ncbi:uncharacterized protein LOC129728193 [Wyeomyia smithii]|uniref:uncharacterized protein LOC129728193 n=1 Tax=Wyeomyia smithii TaxID=174621 RepID=UPI002467E203|nr:uncharacterized protein LOC129728193 [Wyeomyia smithii]
MYRMVRVCAADQPLQRIVWRDSNDVPIRTFELTTVTYGTASAPYLATKCLQQLAKEGTKTHTAAAKVLKEDFYVDDMLSGVSTVEEGKLLIKELIDLLQSAGFSLRKWNSNSEELMQNVPEHLRDERTMLELDSSSATIKTLGLVWEPNTDSFRISTPKWENDTPITKRIILSDASRIFDPLGIVGPVVIQAKLFIQNLWKLQCSWDDPISHEMQEYWLEYRRNLAALDDILVPRWIGVGGETWNLDQSLEFHGFCDASEKAYGACIYLRTVTKSGAIVVRLVTSKSRVAPLDNPTKKKKRQTIPRLELSSALLLAHLYEKVMQGLRIPGKLFLWTDSMIVKCWLSSLPSRWKQFVANRVSEIQHITRHGVWKHVAGVENPADVISRGMTPAQLKYQTMWFSRPQWLLLDEAQWPRTQATIESELDVTELEESCVTVTLQSTPPSEFFGLRSSFTELIRLAAIVKRFQFNARKTNRNCRRLGFLTTTDLNEALVTLVKLAQQESFPQELADLTKRGCVQDSSRIQSLNPIIIEGVLCVGGRLRNASISASRKHPYILDPQHPLTKIIVVHYHRKLFHAGQQLLISMTQDIRIPAPDLLEVEKEIDHLKNNKAAGVDQLPSELSKYGGEALARAVHWAIVKVWEERVLELEEWMEVKHKIARKRPFISKANKAIRLKFANEHADKSMEYLKTVLWTDESKFEIFN